MAITAAKLIDENVLPSPLIADDILIILLLSSSNKYCRFVLTDRKDSASEDFGLSFTTNSDAKTLCPTTPSTGTFVLSSISFLSTILLLKKSFIKIIIKGTRKPII